MSLRDLDEDLPDRMFGDFHKLFPGHYEGAVAESAGALAGVLMANGDSFRWTEDFLKAFRAAVEAAFARGYSACLERAEGDEAPIVQPGGMT